MRGYPVGFRSVCLSILFERCAAFMLASSLLLMLCERYGYPRQDALRIGGLITAAGYFGSLPAGFLADRVLGHRRGLTISLALLSVGYLLLTLPSQLALWAALSLLTAGNSLFKPTAQAVVGQLFAPKDPRLDGAQLWLHLGINVGAVLGAIVAGVAIQRWGWSVTYLLSALAVCIGRLCLFARRSDPLPSHSVYSRNSKPDNLDGISMKDRVKTIAALTLAMLLFNLCYGQVEGSLLLWTRQHVDRTLYGFTVPPSWFVGLPALLVLFFAPAQLALLPRIQRALPVHLLVAFGLLSTALAFAVLIPIQLLSDTKHICIVWIVVSHSLLIAGETLVGPIGLSQVLRLTPPRLVGMMMGVWFVSGAIGYWLAGELGALFINCPQTLGFALFSLLPLLGAGVILLLINKPRSPNP